MTEKPDLVERRLKYIQRQIELDTRAVNVRFRGTPPEGQGPANRHGMPRLPVGQHEVKNWPVLDLGEPFDAARHEAVTTTPVADPSQEGVVIAVLKEGYAIGDEVLRPASVVVGRA